MCFPYILLAGENYIPKFFLITVNMFAKKNSDLPVSRNSQFWLYVFIEFEIFTLTRRDQLLYYLINVTARKIYGVTVVLGLIIE